MEILIFAALSIILLLGWASYLVNQESFWQETFDIREPEVRRRPLPPSDLKNLGLHTNPLAFQFDKQCDGWFEQLDERTWQCLKCRLVHFEKPQETV